MKAHVSLEFNDGHEVGRAHMAAWILMLVMKRDKHTCQLGVE
jgi:hypothetical protein